MNDLEYQEVCINFEKFKNLYYQEKGKKEQLEKHQRKLIDENRLISKKIDTLEKVAVLLKTVSEFAREQSRKKIEETVSNCLQYVFDNGIDFRIEITESRGKPDAEFYVISNIGGEEIKTKPQEARGGGVIDIISLAVRFATIQASYLDSGGFVVLDEPAKHVSEDYINHVAEFLSQMAKVLQRQIIMVTHNKHLSEIAEKWYRIEINEGVSRIVIES